MAKIQQNPVGSEVTFVPHQPPPPLAQFVEPFWYVAGQVPYQREKILLTEYIELIFNLGRPYKLFPSADSPQYEWPKTHRENPSNLCLLLSSDNE